MLNLREYHAIAEQAIANLGIQPESCEGEQPGSWTLQKGSAQINVEVFVDKNHNIPYVRVYSKIMKIPDSNIISFYKELLELNMNYIGITFGKSDDWIFLKADREAHGLDINEMYAMIIRIGSIADKYDDKLIKKYTDDFS